ncbi:MAG: hypothetical protein EDM05_047570 [Leptolyngbya sp. IPPAS B-1204]|nr:hypothetical protein [Elainella sp. C42_A2020_010]RNJ70665.1 MAG: hypothetical protein EDM05_01380 [Leptolyngbya sp. IPPAS B-1204]
MAAITNTVSLRPMWRTAVLATLAFWLSGSLLLDLVIMPTLYATGMMVEPGFATAGYVIFGVFNRIELICAALILTGVLVLSNTNRALGLASQWMLPLAVGLLGIVLVCTYQLAPEMSALGLELNWFEPATVPALMNQMHLEYWLLELMKLAGMGLLLGQVYRAS